MTDRNVREQLNNVRRVHREVAHDLERREALMAKATRVNAAPSDAKVKTSPVNQHEVILAMIADLDLELNDRMAYLTHIKNEARQLFEASDLTREESEVMELRYISCYDWDEIAELLYWSKRTVQRIHGNALEKVGTRWHTLAHSDTRKV